MLVVEQFESFLACPECRRTTIVVFVVEDEEDEAVDCSRSLKKEERKRGTIR